MTACGETQRFIDGLLRRYVSSNLLRASKGRLLRSAAHPSVETSAHLITRKRQLDSVTVPLMDFSHNTDARHWLIIQINLETAARILRSYGAAQPISEPCYTLTHIRSEGIDSRLFPLVWTTIIALGRVRG